MKRYLFTNALFDEYVLMFSICLEKENWQVEVDKIIVAVVLDEPGKEKVDNLLWKNTSFVPI